MSKVLRNLNTKETYKSLSILKEIQDNIPERSFHLQGHIIYDLINMLDKERVTYAEIGSYCGASASLAASNKKVANLYCIDPLVLKKEHYRGSLSQEETLKKNLLKINTSAKIKIFKKYSNDKELFEYFKNNSIDILYIDGDHRFNGVVSDFENYKGFISPGGFIIFDDYYDLKYSPGVKKAVDFILKENYYIGFEPLGCPDNVNNIKFQRKNNLNKISSFIFQKKL
ncbi:class I SAM-dependent methyltransferase [bacterium]|nr:class I SAM-dependent methyltransferase [bacterium]